MPNVMLSFIYDVTWEWLTISSVSEAGILVFYVSHTLICQDKIISIMVSFPLWIRQVRGVTLPCSIDICYWTWQVFKYHRKWRFLKKKKDKERRELDPSKCCAKWLAVRTSVIFFSLHSIYLHAIYLVTGQSKVH